ncbi:hypothetical protein IFR04_015017 [Cadophora malorum]|uniref:Dihydrodipicolinate synthase n=1 Tax=Cadophora malorum TaxID=108018 RepID=A0A8H7W5S1_9HELO|nr:hypothetical protein IFR04_015017 [Cadophora malorum]
MTSTIANKAKPLPSGVYCPVLSIYDTTPAQDIDLKGSYDYFSYLIRGGVTGLVLGGTTAEAVLLVPSEKQDLIQEARKAALDLGFPQYPLVAGISGHSTRESIQLAKDAASAGADFGLLLPPCFWAKAVNKDVILGFYRDVADASPIPVLIYCFPAVCNGVDLNSDVLSELAQHPNIAGVKLTCGNAGKVTRLTQEFSHNQFGVYGGSSDWLIPCMIGGGSGCVTGIGNVFPKSVSKLYALWTEGKTSEAVKLQGLVAQAEKACKEGIAPTKFGASYFARPKAGITRPEAFWPRKPFLPSPKAMQDWVVSVMKDLNEVELSLPDVNGPGLKAVNGTK